MNHQGTKTLQSRRLLLRRFSAEDAPAMYENWANDPEVTKYLRWPHHAGLEVSQSVIAGWVSHYRENDFYNWAIVLKESDMPVGSIGVVGRDDGVKTVHIGYCLGKRWWGRGITAEALKLLIGYFFNEVGANRIEARHDPKNPNSGKVMVKCGFRYEGTQREADWNNQGVCDAAYYAVLAKDLE
ncbi:MAG: GNAT family N-acetyltransferase [Clostridiales bacterium]|nr:GNAT family N-acetyltransferase [Clostridiales bacterium]